MAGAKCLLNSKVGYLPNSWAVYVDFIYVTVLQLFHHHPYFVQYLGAGKSVEPSFTTKNRFSNGKLDNHLTE